MARDHPKKASSSSTKESNTNKSLSTRTSETARDHPKKASSSSKKESNTNMSLTTRNETVSLSQHDKCAIIITRLFRFNKRIKAEIAYDNDRYNRKYAAREKDNVVKKFCANVEKNASNIMKLCYPEESNAMKERIRAYFHHSRSAQSELVKIRREYEQKVTSPLMENLERFSFHEDTAEKNTQIFQLKREECWLLRRIRNLVDKSCKRRKLIKDLETKTKAVEAQASLITGEKDKRIIELEATIKEYKENSIGKNKHITELEERLGGGDKNLPLVDSLIMEEKDKRIMELEAIINEYKENLSNKNKHITELEEKLGGGNDNMSHVDNGEIASNNKCNPTPQNQHASTISNNYYYNVNVNPADTYSAFTSAFTFPFQYGIQGVQYGIHDRQYGQDGQLQKGLRKRKCHECNNYGCKGSNNREKCDKKMVKRDEWGLNLREKSYQSGVFILEILKNALGSNPCEKMHYCEFRFESLRSHNQERTNDNRAKTKACLGKSLVSREYEGTKFY